MSDMVSIRSMHMERWLEASHACAAALLDQQVTLKEAMNALRFFFVRKAIAINGGSIAKAAASVDSHRNTLCRSMRVRTARMPAPQRALAENWATWLAAQGASLGEAERIFAAALVKAGREMCRGNQCKAAELLGIHRNSVRRIATRVAELGSEGRA